MGFIVSPPSIRVGSIGYFPRTTAPDGWLKRNGAAVSRTAYAALFAEIGTTFGVGDGVTTFNLPEDRGEFMRGLDDGRGVDSARVIGSAQAGEIQSHSHTTGQYVQDLSGVEANQGAGTANQAALRSGTAATGGTETRPRNRAYLACIKY